MNPILNSLLAKRITLSFLTILSITIVLTSMNYFNSAKTLTNEIETQIENKIHELANVITLEESLFESELILISNMDDIRNFKNTYAHQVQEIIDDYSKTMDGLVEHIYIADSNGIVVFDNANNALQGIDVSDRDYFNENKNGNTSWSDVLTSNASGNQVIVVSVPLLNDDNNFTGIMAVVVKFEHFEQIINDVKIGENGYAYLLSKEGIILSHPSKDKIGVDIRSFNIDSLNAELPKMLNGEHGSLHYTYNGITKLNMYEPVGHWSLSINADEAEYLEPVNKMLTNAAIIGIIALVLGSVVTAIDAYINVKKIKTVSETIATASQGNLIIRVPIEKSVSIGKRTGDELDRASLAINNMLNNWQGIVTEIKSASLKLSEAGTELSASSEENQAAAVEIANCMQEISSGAQQQVTSIKEANTLFETIQIEMENSNSASEEMAENAKKVSTMASSGYQVICQTTKQMTDVKTSSETTVKVINSLIKRSQEIENINSLISEIADQTNLLALNAAIEAARAGEQGKGFAVVADEIRKLAAQSQSSASSIQSLILELQKDINEASEIIEIESTQVDNGLQSVKASESTFMNIKNSIESIHDRINAIVKGIEATTESSTLVSTTMTDVVQLSQQSTASSEEVSASSEELTAASEEMAASAQLLSSLSDNLMTTIEQFITE